MKDRNAYLMGILLRIERIRQQKGQKEVCYGICVPSYLSKIEHGAVQADPAILTQLFRRLGIRYETDSERLAEKEKRIEEYFYNLLYHLDTKAVYAELKQDAESLAYGCNA